MEALAARGSERLVLSRLPFEDQVATFREAEVVVGPHGAGLTNLAFTAAGTAVVERQPETGRCGHFAVLARGTGGRYASVVCSADPAPPQDLVVDVDEVVSVLDTLLAH